MNARLGQLFSLLLGIGLLVGVGAALLSFAIHAWLLLSYHYPLDYGEGPLVTQIAMLRTGTPVWHLYRDPSAFPYVITNYPPLYPLLISIMANLSNSSTLLVGRIVSLLSTFGCVIAIALLVYGHSAFVHPSSNHSQRTPYAIAVSLLFLTIPIVREWSVFLRVDMFGVCMGLWGLVALQRQSLLGATLLFLLTLYTKPSLLAAPIAGCVWVASDHFQTVTARLFHSKQMRLAIVMLIVGGGGIFWFLQVASDGWFSFHVITANANRWDSQLAYLFWSQQAEIRWPLALAAIGGLVAYCALPKTKRTPSSPKLPVLYTLAAVLTALGVGKVGAYANYFLEFYAGLIWLIGNAIHNRPQTVVTRLLIPILVLASLMLYPPMWDTKRLYRAGVLEAAEPRLMYAMWSDLKREIDVLHALRRVQDSLIREIQATNTDIITDIPGVAAEAGRHSRIQAFEHRQLFDQGHWDQQPLLLDLANGNISLAIVEYLGNWLTPQIITIINHRYAQDGSRGMFDLYRPVDPGPPQPVHMLFDHRVSLVAYHLGNTTIISTERAIAQGNLLVVTLEWQSLVQPHRRERPALPDLVMLQLVDTNGTVVAQSERTFLYGVWNLDSLPERAIAQHMQLLQLPPDIPIGKYQLVLSLRKGEKLPSQPQPLTTLHVIPSAGHFFAETKYFVPEPLYQTWNRWGGIGWAGVPLTPAVPFAWGVLQCFEHTCLELRNGVVSQRALGEQLYLAETSRSATCWDKQPANQSTGICAGFAPLLQKYSQLGPAISGEVSRNGFLVQWTRYARLERSFDGNYIGLGRLGDDVQRLPPGVRYRWIGE